VRTEASRKPRARAHRKTARCSRQNLRKERRRRPSRLGQRWEKRPKLGRGPNGVAVVAQIAKSVNTNRQEVRVASARSLFFRGSREISSSHVAAATGRHRRGLAATTSIARGRL
jgi:hypothetical protein